MSYDYHDTVLDIINMINIDENRFLNLAALLRKLKDTQPNDFATLVEWPKLGRRKAYYLVEIDEAFGDKADLHPRLSEIGWTKAAKIAKFATPENIDDLLELAESYTALELELLLKGAEIKPGSHFVTLRLDPSNSPCCTACFSSTAPKRTRKPCSTKRPRSSRPCRIWLRSSWRRKSVKAK